MSTSPTFGFMTPITPISIAPMIQYTDSNWRTFFRLVSLKPLLYSEMVMDNTLVASHNRNGLQALKPWLIRSDMEGDVALQLGGGGLGLIPANSINYDSIETFTKAAELSYQYAAIYNPTQPWKELNVNAGCPSKKATGLGFGADLMRIDAQEHTRALLYETNKKVNHLYKSISVKCRIGCVGSGEPESALGYKRISHFIAELSAAGIRKFIVHARVCVLSGLSTGENRSIPPLRYDVISGLVRDFPECEFVLSGGVESLDQAQEILDGTNFTVSVNDYDGSNFGGGVENVITRKGKQLKFGSNEIWSPGLSAQDYSIYRPAGVMIGRAAYNDPILFNAADSIYSSPSSNLNPTYSQIIESYSKYVDETQEREAGGMFEGCVNFRTSTMIKPCFNLFSGVTNNKSYKSKLNTLLISHKDSLTVRELVANAVEGTIEEEVLRMTIKESFDLRKERRLALVCG